MQTYLFRRYNPKYRTFFASEKSRIAKAVGSAAKIEHVGSTAVPSLGGKGILDIMVGVSTSKMVGAKERLEKVGYDFREKASHPERLFFRKDYPYGSRKRRVHVHLTKLNGRDWKEIIGFRDYLIKHPDVLPEYAKVKKEAVKRALGEGEKYRKHKEKFIKSILRKALKS